MLKTTATARIASSAVKTKPATTAAATHATDTPLLRLVTLLERIGTPDARKVLEDLAGGAPAAWLTIEARHSLQRGKLR